jgi:8-oxo-dGTP diphosphatase
MPTVGVFAAVSDARDHFLCVRHNYANREWGMPGGRVEPGEDPISAVKREILEETGVVASIERLHGVYSAPYRDDLVLLFEGTVEEEGSWRANEEIAEIGFFPLDGLPEPMGPNARLRFGNIASGAEGLLRVLASPGREVTVLR